MAPPGRPREKGGSGPGPWLLFAGTTLVLLVFTFALGMLVGQHWARSADPSAGGAAAESGGKPTTAPRRGSLVGPLTERPPREKLTFYQTLTAPLEALPATGKPDVAGKAEALKPRPPAEQAPSAGPPVSAPRTDKPVAPSERAAPARAPSTMAGDWAVQVGVFKDRGQAEKVRRPLAANGLDAYVSATLSPEGQMSYRVRVGGFKSREDAARLAARVRQERSLPTFVTAR